MLTKISSRIVQHVKVLATKSDHLSSIHGIHTVGGTNAYKLSSVLHMCTVAAMHAHTHRPNKEIIQTITIPWGWRNVLIVKNIYWSCRGPKFSSQDPHCMAHNHPLLISRAPTPAPHTHHLLLKTAKKCSIKRSIRETF